MTDDSIDQNSKRTSPNCGRFGDREARSQRVRLAAISPIIWAGLWLILIGTALATRPILPVDETRYLAVAWEMWNSGDYLVPHLNGQTYSHKPPLLFWLMNAGWAVFGPNDWWPRLVAPLFGLGCLLLTARTARWMWPEIKTIYQAAPVILLGCVFWTLFATLTMFDMILSFCTLLAINGLLGAWRRNSGRGFVLFGLAIGLGFLAKGPAILLTTLAPALLAPLWGNALGGGAWRQGWKQWYLKLLLALAGGLTIGLAWAIPAGLAGGEEYRNAIFWGQTTGRMVDSFAHSEPWWWYLVILPALILPWTIWPTAWRAVPHLLKTAGPGVTTGMDDGGLRFCLIWFVPAFVAFSAISGKQFHYLLPVFPALALMLARLMVEKEAAREVAPVAEKSQSRSGIELPAALYLILGGALFLITSATAVFELPIWANRLNIYPGIGLAILALALVWLDRMGKRSNLMTRLYSLTTLSTALVVAVHFGARPLLAERHDLRAISEKLAAWQYQGVPIAYVGTYHGQFHFIGRLTAPIATFSDEHTVLPDWLAANPLGRVITIGPAPSTQYPGTLSYPFRGRYFVINEVPDTINILSLPAP